ncbi:hypothetical protein SPHINGOAX6_50022 [Sphingomonas sp. AX6]|nr:hypothetical protein SPHINGOAX6_50022 [Sphingomonas sp. AX6]
MKGSSVDKEAFSEVLFCALPMVGTEDNDKTDTTANRATRFKMGLHHQNVDRRALIWRKKVAVRRAVA